MFDYKDQGKPIETRVQDLITRMTLREKIGQLNQRMFGWNAYEKTPDGYVVTEAFREEVSFGNGLGAVYGIFRADPWSGKTHKSAVEAGALACMAAYNDIDGVFCHTNSQLLTGILRKSWGFQGIVMSDGCAVDNLIQVFGSEEKAVAEALKAGVDLNLWNRTWEVIENAVVEGLISVAEIDNAVARVLRIKYLLGLFETPYVTESAYDIETHSNKLRDLSLQLAREGIVLLENKGGCLSLSMPMRRIAVIGPNADALYNQLGDYTPPQRTGTGVTILEGVRSAVGNTVDIEHVAGCGIRSHIAGGVEEAVRAAAAADVSILVLGGSSARDFTVGFDENGAALPSEIPGDMDCGEGMDPADIGLPDVQIELFHAVMSTGTKVVVILVMGQTVRKPNTS